MKINTKYTDLLGRLVLKGTIEDEINVSGLLAGTYILRIGNESKRFVKE
ncbi:MAG: T9SS type A sorting domain-containing protein [Flavobacteriales bacterium]|nr:T9SS type A sorting domain-containing protein [Flavobacteriales bacterium]